MIQFKKLTVYSVGLIVLVAMGAVIGICAPSFYEWTGSDQSRPKTSLWLVPLSLFVGAFLFCCALPWIPVSIDSSKSKPVRIRFNIRSIFVLMTVTAIIAAFGAALPTFVIYALYAASVVVAICYAALHADSRYAIATLFGCMNLPFVWLLTWGNTSDMIATLAWILMDLPGLLPMGGVARLIGQNPHELLWVAKVFTSAEILLGVWFVSHGPKHTLGYLALLLSLAAFTSVILNAMMRA